MYIPLVIRFRGLRKLAFQVFITTFHEPSYGSVGDVHVALEPHGTPPALIYVISEVNLYHFRDRRPAFALFIVLS